MKRCLLALFFAPLLAVAAPDEDWARIVAMDAGPARKPTSREDAQLLARQHFATHRALIESFLAANPDDPRAFDAKLRLTAILAATGQMDGNQKQVDEAMRLLGDLEKSQSVPVEKRADAGFRRVSLYLQSLRGREAEMRTSLVDAARGFTSRYPGDRRGPRLLVEVSSICDNDPALKRDLLTQARSLSTDEPLNRRIADDLTRLNKLDKPFEISFSTLQGRNFDSSALRGNVVVIVFWSAESPHCILWLPKFRKAIAALPKENLRVATVALDSDRNEVSKRLAEFQMSDWPTFFDGLGWENAIARPLGINALPTVFVIDRAGILRSINARDNVDIWVRRLLREGA